MMEIELLCFENILLRLTSRLTDFEQLFTSMKRLRLRQRAARACLLL